MVFFLINTVNGEIIDLTEPKVYTIGRKNCTITIENDQSLSRIHAKIVVKDGKVTIQDCKSRYHTIHNNKELEPNKEIQLNSMDILQFGIYNSKFRFESNKYVVAASSLSSERKVLLKQALSKCNATFIDKWHNICTHLSVDTITLTIKVLQALVDEKPIVTCNYWMDYAKTIENNESAPDINNYKNPPIAEQLLRSDFECNIDPRRKTLFVNKMFVFSTKASMKLLEDVIKRCGGESISYDDQPITLEDIKNSPKTHLLIQADEDKINIQYNTLITEYSKQEKRPIPLNEIALAIVLCSCEVNCNPKFNKVSAVFESKKEHKIKPKQSNVLAAETQTQIANTSSEFEDNARKVDIIIPPSMEDVCPIQPGKRPNKENEQSSRKKIKLNDSNSLNSSFQWTSKTNLKDRSVLFVEDSSAMPESSETVNSPSQDKKRKLDEELNPFENIQITKKTKLPSSNLNPFGSSKNNSIQNSGKVVRNPFSADATLKMKPAIIKLETPEDSKLDILNKTVEASGKSRFSASLNATLGWISNKIKSNVKIENCPELDEISKLYQGCVKITRFAVLPRSRIPCNVTTVENNTKNFKRFKKVQPLHPQQIIIGKQQLKKCRAGKMSDNNITDENNDDDTNEKYDEFGDKKKFKPFLPIRKTFIL